ncbi:MAG: hypothetical protein IJ660_01865 [Alphaproteobacteria bacterium]|nr:hypothetical protein [Alphaproteobacteria bacterium]
MTHNICDTVRLCIDVANIEIKKPENFIPNARIVERINKNIDAIYDPKKLFLKYRGYVPRIKLSKQIRVGGYRTALLIEFSAPKMLFGNNLQEICDEDFDRLIEKLKEYTSAAGIEISEDCLRNAPVVGIHYGKNISLTVSVSSLLQEFKRCKFQRYFDVCDTSHKNGGETVRVHTSFFEVAWYDKITECSKNSYRRCEKDDGIYQNISFKQYADCRVLRQEVRLNRKRYIRNLLKKCEINVEDLTFKYLFNSTISQKINLYIFRKIQQARVSGILENPNSYKAYALMLKEKGYKIPKIMELIGFMALCKEMEGVDLQKLTGKSRTPFLKNLQKDLADMVSADDYFGAVFTQISRVIEQNTIIKIGDKNVCN